MTNTEFDKTCEEVATTAFLACNAKREILEDIANMDEAEVLNLILDKLRNTATNRDFLATIKVG